MTQAELEREVAQSIGESLDTIRQRGFSLVVVPDRRPLVVDWEAVYPCQPLRKPRTRSAPRRAA